MSNLLVALLFCVGLLTVGWAVENSSVSAQPDDKDKDKGKKPGFRAGAVRYQVKDVDRSVGSIRSTWASRWSSNSARACPSQASRTGAPLSG